MSGKTWSDADTEKLRQAYARKPYSQSVREFCAVQSKRLGRTEYGVSAKVQEFIRSGEVTDEFPKVLIFDIETLMMEFNGWQLKTDYIQPENIRKDWAVSCWSAKWLLEPEIMGACVTPEEATNRDDERILKPLWKLINKADVVIAHNGKKFDLRKINTRFLFYNMGDPLPFQMIDTLLASRSKFGFSSFKLDYINKYLGLDGKESVTGDDHRDCVGNNLKAQKKALAKIARYNKWDTYILEEYYMRIRAYIAHPNFAAWSSRVVDLEKGEVVCPVCRGAVANSRFGGEYVTPAGIRYETFRCGHCGAVGRRNTRKHSAPTVKRV